MPVNIDIVDFKCFNQLRNGEDFDKNLLEFTPNLVGNIGERVKIEFKANLYQTAFAGSTEEWNMDIINDEITRSSGSFLDDSIQVGDQYTFYADWLNRKNTSEEYFAEVLFISSDGKTLKYNVLADSDTTSGLNTNVGLVFNQFVVPQVNTAFFLKFGLLGNDETFNYNSKTTEAPQVYYASGLESPLPAEVDAESLGSIKDWVSGSLKVTLENFVPDLGGAQYTVEQDFIINPFYILSYREFIDSGTIPELLAGDSSLKYAAELDFRKTLTDTGSSKIRSFDGLDGFVGWYGENFNGLNNDYAVKSISYEEAIGGDPLEAININVSTKAIITVEKVVGSITDYSCAAYLFKIPKSEDDYIGTTADIPENFLFKAEIVSSPDTSSANVATSLVSGDLVIEYTIDYLTAEKLQLTTDDEYILLVQIEDPTIGVGDSDRVMIIADLRNYVDIDYLAGFINVPTYGFLQHGEVLGVDVGEADPITSNEDGLLLDAVFGADTTRDVVINSITAKLVAHFPAENKNFELDSYSFSIGDLILSGGVQQIEVDTVRGYPLAAGDDFNLVRIITGAQVGDFQQYSLQLGQKIKWQEWLFNPSVDSVFFDASKANNNLNRKSSNYSGKESYEIQLALVINVTGKDDLGRIIIGDFIHFGGIIDVNDYDESDDAVTGTIQTFDVETGQSLDGDILYNGKNTLFKAVFENAAGQKYGIHRIEPIENPGDGIFELSSLISPVVNNLLKPVDGETLLKFTPSGSQVTTECLIDGSLITEGVIYRLSARVGPLKLEAPTDLIMTSVSKTSNQIDWTSNSVDETGFGIERSTLPTSGFVEIDTVGPGVETFTDNTITDLGPYYYRVRALGPPNSSYTNTVSIFTLAFSVSGANMTDVDAAYFIIFYDQTDTAIAGYMDTFVLNLKTGLVNGTDVWTNAATRAILPFVGGTAAKHAGNLRDPGNFEMVFVNSPGHSATGVDFSVVGSYGKTGVNSSVDLTQDDFMLSAYKTAATAGAGYLFGAQDLTPNFHSLIPQSASNISFLRAYNDVNLAGRSQSAFTSSDSLCTWTKTSVANYALYRRAVTIDSQGGHTGGGIPPNLEINFHSRNLNGVADFLLAQESRGYGIGKGITASQNADWAAAWQALQTSLGRQIA